MARNFIGKKIKKLREEKGLTQQELAKKTGASQQNIQYFENNNPRALALDLAELFGIDPYELTDKPLKKKRLLNLLVGPLPIVKSRS